MLESLVDLGSPTLSDDELGWLLGLATGRRKKREDTLKRMRQKPGQADAVFLSALQQVESAVRWAATVEDHLIVLLGDRDSTALRPPHLQRYLRLREQR